MKKSKVLGLFGSDNFRLEDCPMALPKENMKFFQYMRQLANTEPYDNYQQYGNAYRENWREQAPAIDRKMLKIMEAINVGIGNAINEYKVQFPKDFDTMHENKMNFLKLFIDKYISLHEDEDMDLDFKDLDGRMYVYIKGKKYIVITAMDNNYNLSVRQEYFSIDSLAGFIFLHDDSEHGKQALILDRESVLKAYYQTFKSKEQFIYKYYYKMPNGRLVSNRPDPINAPSSEYAILRFDPMLKVANFRGEVIDVN